jgi:AcrR family transcriptional regulator
MTTTVAKRKRPRLTRLEKSEQTQEQLIEAAADVVGKHGYADASVTRIMEAAGLAQGTFYNYFDTRQDILDLLPPRYAVKMLQYIGERMDRSLVGLEREVARFSLYFDFLHQTTQSMRVVSEAPVLAPEGFVRFSKIVKDNYVEAISKSIEAGDIAPMDPVMLSNTVDVLIAIRNGLAQQRQAPKLRRKRVSDDIVDNYRSFIARALFSDRAT